MPKKQGETMTQRDRIIRLTPPLESTRRFIALGLMALFLVSSIPATLFAQAEIEINKEETREQGSETLPSPPSSPATEGTESGAVREQRKVHVERRIGNPMAEIFKNTLYGALTGLLVGGILIAIDSEDSDERRSKLSTSTAVGAGVGLLYGVFVVTSMERQVAAIEWDGERLALNMPRVGVALTGQKGNQSIGAETAFLRVRF
jgi:hypothetical protein